MTDDSVGYSSMEEGLSLFRGIENEMRSTPLQSIQTQRKGFPFKSIQSKRKSFPFKSIVLAQFFPIVVAL